MPELSSDRQPLSAKEKRELDIEIDFLSGLVKRDPAYIEALQLLGDNYTKRGCFNDGLKIDEHLSKLLPDDSMVFYNLACSYSLTDRIDESSPRSTRRCTSATKTPSGWTPTRT